MSHGKAILRRESGGCSTGDLCKVPPWRGDSGRLPGGCSSQLEFDKSCSFNEYLSHAHLGHSAVFTRLMEVASWIQGNNICRSWESEHAWVTLRVQTSWALKLLRPATDSGEGQRWVFRASHPGLGVCPGALGSPGRVLSRDRARSELVLEGSPWSLKKAKKGWQSCWVEPEGSRREADWPEGITGAPGLRWV